MMATTPGEIEHLDYNFRYSCLSKNGTDSSLESNVTIVLLICAGLGFITLHLYRTWWRLRQIPGPLPAKFTNFQRMGWIGTKRAHLILQDMHERYGEVVRIGPNMVSFSNPEAIPTVYPTRPGFPKVCIRILVLHEGNQKTQYSNLIC